MARMPDEVAVGEHGLVLRRWMNEDLDALMGAIERSYPELHLWMPWAAEMPTREAERNFLTRLRNGFEAATDMGFGLFEINTGEVVGSFGLHARRGQGVLEIGYWVRSDRTRRGYGTAAARALTSAAFMHFPEVGTVEIRCDAANHASAAIPRKLGFRLVDEFATDGGPPATTGRHLVWAVTRAEWDDRRESR